MTEGWWIRRRRRRRSSSHGLSMGVAIVLAVAVAAAAVAAEDGACPDPGSGGAVCPNHNLDDGGRPNEPECGVYVAPSTLGNASNLGVFAGKPMAAGDVVPWPELVVPLMFREWDSHPKSAQGDGSLWDRYLWEGAVADIEPFDDWDRARRKAVFVPGVGCTVNSALGLHNIESTSGSSYDAGDRSHPGAGSFSPYHGSETRVVRGVAAGTELLASYGESWIPWVPGNPPVTTDANLDAADDLLREFAGWLETTKARHGEEHLSPELLKRLWGLARGFPGPSRKVTGVLPEELDWEALVRNGGPPIAARDYWRAKQRVPLGWLREHGYCQDHLKPGVSGIPGAGRGAFAARFLPAGTVVGFAPLIHAGERFRDFGRIRYQHPGEGGGGAYEQLDLIVNYSFSHRNSTVVLTPYGAMVNYINHSRDKASVRVRWPEKASVSHEPDWLTRDAAFLRDTTTRIGLSLEYVALRDIHEGEEVFLDYGDDWQEAWEKHANAWVPPADAGNYVHSSDYRGKTLKTPPERQEDPYPPNLITVCKESFRREGDKYVFLPVLRNWEDYVPCEVLARTGDGVYTVRLLADPEPFTVHGVPFPGGIELVDRAFSQDWHLPGAFRHPLSIPDDVFPEPWKNL